MTYDLRLHSGGLASYRWGSLMLDVGRLGTTSGALVVRALAGTLVGTFPFEEAREARGALAILHEVMHLQQDLATGVGAWDHLVTREAFPFLTSETRWFITELDDSPYPTSTRAAIDRIQHLEPVQQVRERMDSIARESVGYRQLRGDTWASKEVQSALFEITRIELDSETLARHSLRRLLEGEAAALIHAQIVKSRATMQGREMLERHDTHWNILKMGDDYASCFFDTAQAIANGLPEPAAVRRSFDVHLFLTAWIIDIALSYPPPSVLDAIDVPRVMYEPVLRYLLLLRGMNRQSQSAFGQMGEALAAKEWEAAEGLLLANCEVGYPTSRRIYLEWLDELQHVCASGGSDVPLFQLRYDAIQHRFDDAYSRGMSAIIGAETPIQVVLEGDGVRGILIGRQLLQEVSEGLISSLALHNIDIELYEWFHGRGVYQCLLGRAGVCDARLESCVKGVTRFSELPGAGCQVRDTLKGIGYAI